MKTKFAIAAALLLSISVSAQKEELKALKKIDDKEQPTPADLQEYKRLLTEAEPKMAAATDEQKAEFHFYKGTYTLIVEAMGNPNPIAAKAALETGIESLNQVIELEKNGKKKYTKIIQDQVYPEIKATLLNMAGELGKQKQYKYAAPLYETVYRMSPKDTLYLYNAAAYAVNAQDYDLALNYFERLEKLGFTGSGINYTAKNAKGEVEYYGDKKVRDLLISQKTHTEPGIFREPSKRNDIIKNIALIYIQKGDKVKAKQAIDNAKRANPNDTSLLLAEAQIYLEAKDYDSYKKTATEVLNKGSKDPNLYFNLGVTTAKSGQVAEAEQYYLKAIELKPDFSAAYQNIAILQLDGEEKIVNEMNSLGTSVKDTKRYDELKKQRDDKYRKAMKYLEQGHKADPANKDIRTLLGTIYQGLEMQKEYNALKAKP